MRIMLWGNCYPRVGGIETFIGHLARALTARGHAVGVISDGSGAREVLSGHIPVWTAELLRPLRDADPAGILAAQAAIRRALDEFAPDVLHYNTSAVEIVLFLRALRDPGLPVVTTLHNGMFTASGSPLLRRVCARSHAMTAVSDHTRDSFAAAFPDLAGRVRVIANALPPGAPPAPITDRAHIVALGRVLPEKGFDTLIAAFALLAPDQPQARLTIWGDGPDRLALIERIGALGLSGRIAMPGWCEPDEASQRLAEAAIVAMPSRWQEPFGLVALEAAQAARPIVASRVGALPSIVEEGHTGLLVPPDDPQALAAALTKLLRAPAEAAAMGLAAQAAVDRRFGFTAMVDAYEALFTQAVTA